MKPFRRTVLKSTAPVVLGQGVGRVSLSASSGNRRFCR
jgi:hypothetical protein